MCEEKKNESLESDSKMAVLEELRDMMAGLMGDKVKNSLSPKPEAMEVSVAAEDPESLESGLEMAQHALPDAASEEPAMEDDMELEEIEALIRELEDKKREKLMKA